MDSQILADPLANQLLQALYLVVADAYYSEQMGDEPRCGFCQRRQSDAHEPDCTMHVVLTAIVAAERQTVTLAAPRRPIDTSDVALRDRFALKTLQSISDGRPGDAATAARLAASYAFKADLTLRDPRSIKRSTLSEHVWNVGVQAARRQALSLSQRRTMGGL